MKRTLSFSIVLLIFSMIICLTSCCSYFNRNEEETTEESKETIGETAGEEEFKVFTRYASDGKAVLYSFNIPESWQFAKEELDSSYSRQESFFNSEKTKLVFISITSIDDLKKLGITKLSGEDSFSIAIDKVKEYYISSGLLGKLEQKGEGSFIGENKRIQAYLSRFEGPTDLSNLGTEFGKLSEKGGKTIYISFLSYDDRLIGYYFMIDALSDIEDDENIIANFVNTLKISKF